MLERLEIELKRFVGTGRPGPEDICMKAGYPYEAVLCASLRKAAREYLRYSPRKERGQATSTGLMPSHKRTSTV